MGASLLVLVAVFAPCMVGGFVLPRAQTSHVSGLCAKRESLSTLMDEFKERQWKKEALPARVPFSPGDTVKIGCEIVEGKTTRIQIFEGVVIARSGAGYEETFTVRKVTSNIGVERVFPLYAPLIKSLTVTRRGNVRRAKLYYLRGLSGKSARLGTKVRGLAKLETEIEAVTAANKAPEVVAVEEEPAAAVEEESVEA